MNRRVARSCVAVLILVAEVAAVTAADTDDTDGLRPTHVRSFADLVQYAEQVAERPYEPHPALPPAIANLSYDEYRLIAFDVNHAIWRGSDAPFSCELFHRGFVHEAKVGLYQVLADATKEVPFRPEAF